MLTHIKQFSSIRPFFTGANIDNVVSREDQDRLQAYDAYEDFYYNRPESLKIQIRGDSLPMYLPSMKKIVEAKNRFLAVKYNFLVDPSSGAPQDRALMQMLMGNLFRREELWRKFATQRRHGLIRGDQVWHITADSTKVEGSRISVHTVDPSHYFPIEDPNVPTRVIGVHLVDKVQDPRQPEDKSKKVARRQTYRRVVDTNGQPTGVITSEVGLYELAAWDDRNLKPADIKLIQQVRPVFELPPEITSIPVYHIRNNDIPDVIFGVSEGAGIETLINGLNQGITDEDLTLVLQGLGMYWTNAGAPQNPDGYPAPWNLGPGQVVEVGDDQQFGRVTGVSSVAPYLDHMNFVDGYMQQGVGVPDIAAGRVDVAIAESGISLRLQLAPILADNAEKELEILGVMDHMLWDLTHMWYPAYEGTSLEGVEVVSVVDDPMPVNREAKIQEILLLQSGGLITIGQAQAELAKLGYSFNAGDEVLVVQEAQALALARSGDPFANRFGQETEPPPSTTPTVGDAASIAAAGESFTGLTGGNGLGNGAGL